MMKKLFIALLLLAPFIFAITTSKDDIVEDNTNINFVVSDSEKHVTYVFGDFIYDINSLEELSGFSSNIFIGKVSRYMYTDTNMDEKVLPYTYYEVEVVRDLKGKTNKEIILSNFGGYDENGTLYLFQGNSLPVVGEFYIFITTELNDGTYYLEVSTQKILLENDDDLLKINKDLIREIEDAIINEIDTKYKK